MSPVRRWEHALFWLGAAAILALQVVLYFHAGGVWRDEIHSVVVARMPTWSAMWQNLYVDSFPALWAGVLRLWIAAGMGAGDGWMRLLGVIISVGIVAALFIHARLTRGSPPLLALALVAFNPAVFYYGSSLRAYGLAVCLVVLLFAVVWRFVEKKTPVSLAAAVLLAILAANANYQDSYLILAICVSGAAVCALQSLWKRAILILGVGFCAALSMLPYAGVIRQYEAIGSTRKTGVTVAAIWEQFCVAFDPVRGILLPCLFVLLAGSLVVGFRSRRAEKPAWHAALYGGLSIVIAAAALCRFAIASGFPSFPWHFIPFIGLAGAGLDFGWDRLARERPRLGTCRVIVASVLMLLCALPLWNLAHLRRTNLDLVAGDVAEVVSPRDFILVSPFWDSYAFKYYYRGAAPWSTLPIVPADRVDLEYIAIKPFMTQADPLAESFAKIEATLKGGGRLWVVGRMPGPAPGALPPTIHPAPDPVHGWDNVWYMQVWAMQTQYFIRSHAVHFVVVPELRGRPVSPLERAEIGMAEGWKE